MGMILVIMQVDFYVKWLSRLPNVGVNFRKTRANIRVANDHSETGPGMLVL
jgi:hypothetical protein